jgi:methyl coenzyme M reductase beta subunit
MNNLSFGFDVYEPTDAEMVAIYATVVVVATILVPVIIAKGAIDNLTRKLSRSILSK